MKVSAAAIVALVVALPCTLAAEVASIHRDKLPQTTTILAAYDDAQRVEHCVDYWAPVWQCDLTKDDVVATLGKDHGFLQVAIKENPNNIELRLLAAEVDQFAYNVDIPGAFQSFQDALDINDAPLQADMRAQWFRANFECRLTRSSPGAEIFLQIEKEHEWNKLPVAFWKNYANCATLTSMPAHALRALDHWGQLKPGANAVRDTFITLNRKHFDEFNPKKVYEDKDVWRAFPLDNDLGLTATVCGISLRLKKDWKLMNMTFQNGTCLLAFGTGPYKANVGELWPTVMMLVARPEPGETFEQFEQKITANAVVQPLDTVYCPAENCQSFLLVGKGMYKENGDGRSRNLFFQRNEPQYPGLIFESPLSLPSQEGKEGMSVYTPPQVLKRMSGPLYYLIMLDTASSIENDAVKDFDFVVRNMKVE